MNGNRAIPARPRCSWILASLLILAISACAASQGERHVPRSGDVTRPKNLYDYMLSMREAPAEREAGVAACIRQGRSNEKSLSEFLPVIASMMDVSREEPFEAFCHAVAEAAISGDFSEADIRAMYVPRDQRDYRVFGRFLRALLIAHERLNTQEARVLPKG